ncbi:hypothetical protein SOCE836_065800 [Sorangium cellulosum]|uniref:Secreted protein n=1 Tax=Sorangium cellulosum TaxID=56 RepID=A0A4P2QVE8_SORCE|nr:hypothetical protein SOCE836_065800 [Sorangium cellulosum]WCQ93723.1 hypothetical protein NQZ70_06476 [Sorangium sp. Soce836]
MGASVTCPHPSRRGALCAVLALCAVSLGSSRVASGAPPLPRLAVHRAPSAADCPDAASLAAAVERVMNRRAVEPASEGGPPAGPGGAPAGADDAAAGPGGLPAGAGSAPAAVGDAPAGAGVPSGAGAPAAPAIAGVAPEFEVHFLRTDATYTAVLQAGGRARQLSSEPGATCDELVEAVALTVAILLDSQPAPPPAPPPAAPAPVAVPPPRPPPQAPRGDVALELGAAGTVGMLDPLRPAAMADVFLRRSAWSAGLGAVWLPRQDIEIAPGAVSVGLVAATARGCATLLGELDAFRLSACAVSLLGAVHGAGKGFDPDREAAAPWFAVGASALAEGPLFGTRALGWAARATLLAPVVRTRVTIERRAGAEVGAAVTEDPALDPSPVGLLVGLSARVSIF